MKIVCVALSMLLIMSFYPLHAQYNTGDPDLDQTLQTLDLDASISFGAFRTNISKRYHISESNIQYLTVEMGMTAGDIYLTMEMVKITQKSLNDVLKAYQDQRRNGWGSIALQLGVQPGSDKFSVLKDELKSQA